MDATPGRQPHVIGPLAALAALGKINPAFPPAVSWLAAFVVGLLVGSAIDDADVFPLGILLVPLSLLATLALIGFCFWSASRLRGVQAAVACITPFAAIALGAIAFIGMWSIRGVPPLVAAGTNDFQVDQTLTSPDGTLTAVVLDNLSGGPATGTYKEVYIVDRPTPYYSYRSLVFSLECGRDFSFRWVSPRTLRVGYTAGQDDLMGDGLERPPFWVLPSLAHQVQVRVVRNLVSQRSLC